MITYRVIRFYRDRDVNEVIAAGLALDAAQALCSDPESSSVTAVSAEAKLRTSLYGPWFDGYTAEEE